MVKTVQSTRLKMMLKNLQMHLTRVYIVLGIKVAVIFLAALLLFSQDLIIMFKEAFLSEIASYMLVVPFILGYVLYRKRETLKATVALHTSEKPNIKHLLLIAGSLLSTSAVLLYWYGSYTFTPLEYHFLALPLFVSGLVLIMFNLQTLRQLAFPIAFLIFFAPPPERILYEFGATLSIVSAAASNAIVTALGVQSTLSTEFGSPTITIIGADGVELPPFAVDITCSGIYSLIGFLVFALFVVYIVRDKPWKRLTLFLIGFPLIYLLNILRITLILFIGYQFGEALALEAFHLFGGWVLILLGTLSLLFASEKILKTQILTRPSEKCPKCSPKPDFREDFCPRCGRITHTPRLKLSRNDIIKIAAIIVSVTLITSIQAPVFALTHNLAIDINTPYGQPVSTSFLPDIPGYNLTYQQRYPEFEQRSKLDMAIFCLYTGATKEPVWIAIEIASTKSNLHNWEACLITWRIRHELQPIIRQIDQRDTTLIDNPPVIARFFSFQDLQTNQTQAVLYWYETATFSVNSTSQQKYMKISVEAFPDNAQDLDPLEDEMLFVAKTVASFWQPIKTWSHIALALSQNGDRFVLVTTALLAAIITFLFFDKKRKKKENFYAYEKISDSNKKFINILRETERTTLPTMSNITRTYKKFYGKSIRQSELLQELRRAEEAGFIESGIISKNDEPLQTWKTQIAFPKTV